MATLANRLEQNICGKYYVDESCIDCDLCRITAPRNFKRDAESGYSYVFRQPETPDEEEHCLQAKDECPVDAIGNDS